MGKSANLDFCGGEKSQNLPRKDIVFPKPAGSGYLYMFSKLIARKNFENVQRLDTVPKFSRDLFEICRNFCPLHKACTVTEHNVGGGRKSQNVTRKVIVFPKPASSGYLYMFCQFIARKNFEV